jgi:hypothetical protein
MGHEAFEKLLRARGNKKRTVAGPREEKMIGFVTFSLQHHKEWSKPIPQ